MSNYYRTYVEHINIKLSKYYRNEVDDLMPLQYFEGVYVYGETTKTYIYVADCNLKLPKTLNGNLILIGDNIKDDFPALQTTVTGKITLLGSGVEAYITPNQNVFIHNISATINDNLDNYVWQRTEGAAENQIFIESLNVKNSIHVSKFDDSPTSYKALFEGDIIAPNHFIDFSETINIGLIYGHTIYFSGSLNDKNATAESHIKFFHSYNKGTIIANNFAKFGNSANEGTVTTGSYVKLLGSNNRGIIEAGTYVRLKDSINTGSIKEMLSQGK